MKQSDFTFKNNVSLNDMLVMAQNVVESLCVDDPKQRVNRLLGQEYLMLQAETRLFADCAAENDGDPEAFMQMVFAVGVERFRDWLRDNAGAERFRAFERMVERGCKYYFDLSPLDVLVGAAGTALKHLNEMVESSGEMNAETAIGLLKQYLADQEREEQPLEE